MTTLTIDTKAKRVRAEIDIDSIESAGEVVAAIKGASRAVWPEILFAGDAGFDDDVPHACRRERGGGRDLGPPTGARSPAAWRNAFCLTPPRKWWAWLSRGFAAPGC